MSLIRQGGMVCFDEDGDRFQLRAVGIAIREGHLLVHRATIEQYWSLPGGRVERNESAAETLAREMVEELGQATAIGPLLHVVENFFVLGSRRYHEIGLYLRMDVPPAFPFDPSGTVCHRVRDGATDLEFKWVPLDRDALERIRLKPASLIDALLAPDTAPAHYVDREAEPLPIEGDLP